VTTAIVGVGGIGTAIAKRLVTGDEPVVLAGRDLSRTRERAAELGPLARAASVDEAIGDADTVVFALWIDTMRELIPKYALLLPGKVVVDPSNPIGFDAAGQIFRTLPDGQSAASVVAGLLPPGTRYVKAFGTLGSDALTANAHRDPPAVLFYATDDPTAAATAERLIRAAGFEPWKAGSARDAGRLEAPTGDLHQIGFGGEVVGLARARAATAGGSA
jgi:8-hydroxy-5-deazaflavin:NADPH oxidoreductase